MTPFLKNLLLAVAVITLLNGETCIAGSCILCTYQYMYQYLTVFNNPSSLFAEVQNRTNFQALCGSYAETINCIGGAPCNFDGENGLLFTLVNFTLHLMCDNKTSGVVPEYVLNCYLLPEVAQCISEAWTVAKTLPDTCRVVQRLAEVELCFNSSLPSCSNSSVDFLHKLLQGVLPASPSAADLQSCFSTVPPPATAPTTVSSADCEQPAALLLLMAAVTTLALKAIRFGLT